MKYGWICKSGKFLPQNETGTWKWVRKAIFKITYLEIAKTDNIMTNRNQLQLLAIPFQTYKILRLLRWERRIFVTICGRNKQKCACIIMKNSYRCTTFFRFIQYLHIWRILWWAWTETLIRAQPFQKQCSNSNNNDDMFKSRLLRSCGGFYHMLWTALLYFLKENHSNRCCGANQVNHVWSKAGRSTGTACSAIPEHNPSIVHLFRSYIFICSN